MVEINFSADTARLQRQLGDFAAKQVPFATALALTKLAQGVKAVEQDEMKKTFDSPTAFTLNSLAVKPATKTRLKATVYPREIASHYLEPYVLGGDRSLWSVKGMKRGMLVPRGTKVNAFGNLTKGQLARLKGQPNVFIGPVTFKKSGRTVNGVWQRPAAGAHRAGGRGTKGGTRGKIGDVRTGLKLLIQFSDSTPVPRRLPFYEAGQAYLRANARREFARALREAMKTARP